jgi:acetyl-CoA carboxylase biotin carboxyl carrier protein
VDTNDQQRNPDTSASTLAEAAEAVRKLAAVLEDHHLAQIEVTLGKLQIRLKAGKTTEVIAAPPAGDVIQTANSAGSEIGHVVTAPMIGTYYASPSPGDPPFVAVGDRIEVGQVMGIIEAMKIMNEITADRAGTVAEVFVTNAQPVEYGSPLVRLSLT